MIKITHRTARVVSISLIVIFLLLTGIGLALQAMTGKVYLGDTIGLPVLSLTCLALVVWVVIGALILWHYPANPIGWMTCIWPMFVALDLFTFGYYQVAWPLSLPGTGAALVWHNWAGGLFPVYFFTLLFLVFPTGRLLSPPWRWIVSVATLAGAIYIFLSGIEPGPIYSSPYEPLPLNPIGVSEAVWELLNPLMDIALLLSILCLAAGGLSLIIRLRRSHGEERQQIKWFVYFALFFPISQLFVLFWEEFGYQTYLILLLGLIFVLVSAFGMAVAIGIAIFKYQLYTIDIIIRRTLIYGALTAFLAGIYFLSVILLQGALAAVESPQTTVVTVISTLVVVALFTPLRRRLQDAIDRRFYRQKYDAEHALSIFSLQVRNEVDLEILSEGLLRVINDTLHPESASIWLLEVNIESGQEVKRFQ